MNAGIALGLIVIGVSEAATLAGIEPFYSWNTPIAWTGFIVFADSLVARATGGSWLRSSPREFAFLAVVSIPLWLVFEFFNRFIDNWYYVGLPEHRVARYLGYAWSFSTIWPAIFECADLVGAKQGSQTRPNRQASDGIASWSPRSTAACVAGAAMLAWPLVWPSRYLAAPVWLGFIFLLDPVNAWLGEDSLSGDLRRGRYDRMKNLVLSGLVCGVLWEFLNYWSRAKWHYTVPIMEHTKVFEMPLPGYLGFPAFALECFVMYGFVRALAVRLVPRSRFVLGRNLAVP
jgi:hypothetical protein